MAAPVADSPEPNRSEPAEDVEVASLFARHGDELRRFVLGMVGDGELAADVVQSTFLKAVEDGGASRADSPKAWLFRVAYNEAITARRRKAARDGALRRLADQIPLPPSTRPDEALIRAEQVEAVRRALDRLPPEQARVVRARIHDDRTFAEIARDLGLPIGTVLTRMRRALARLRAAIDETRGPDDAPPHRS
ncbi:MAG: RNA polymerase sigma factor [Isosphaeraceae bacterium]